MGNKNAIAIGVDFGTTHTSVAVVDEEQLRFIPLDWLNRQPHLLRSMLYIDRQHQVSLGVKAVRNYLEQDTGRFVRHEDRVVGTVKNTVARLDRSPTEPDGPIEIVYEVVVAEDVGIMGRLIQSIKMGLGDQDYPGTKVFDRFFSIEELVSLILRYVRQRTEIILDRDVSQVVLGRPVRFAGRDSSDQLAEERLRRGAELAGFVDIQIDLEPVAAARFYTRNHHNTEHILVFDFGGGTLDMTILHREGLARNVLATHGVIVGGDDIDSAMMRTKAAPYFGTTSAINADGSPFPAHLAGLLERWQTIPTLSRPQNVSLIHRAKIHGNNPEGFAALESLVMQNYGFALFQELERAKRALSDAESTTVKLETDQIHLAVPVARREMQVAIAKEIGLVQHGISEIIKQSGVDADAIDVVVTTGGSSLIPLFQEILRRRFPQARLVHSNTFGSVAGGLALKAAQQNGKDPHG